MKLETTIKAEETLLFMALMTFAGGFINAYTFFLRGGAFVSFHTGNMVRLGLFLYQRDWAGLWSAAAPILGCLVGVVAANLLKAACGKRPVRHWQKLSVVTELVVLAAVGLVPLTAPSGGVNWVLSVATGFQLNNFRLYEGSVHNTTICTGNLRTFGQHLTKLMLKPSGAALREVTRSFMLVFSFPFGAFVGALLCPVLGAQTVWVAALSMLGCWLLLLLDRGEAA